MSHIDFSKHDFPCYVFVECRSAVPLDEVGALRRSLTSDMSICPRTIRLSFPIISTAQIVTSCLNICGTEKHAGRQLFEIDSYISRKCHSQIMTSDLIFFHQLVTSDGGVTFS